MPVSFDPVNKYILITSGTELTALEIYNATMDWCDDQPTMSYSVPMRAVGKAPLGGGVYTDSIFILQDGWKIKLYNGTYQFIIKGTVITDDESSRTVPPDSGNVEVVFQVTSQGTVIPDVAEWTQTEKNGIISNVDVIQAKTDKLPDYPASEPTVEAVKLKTDSLPTFPANELTTLQEASDIKGNPGWTDESLKAIYKKLEEGITQRAAPKSIAEQLEQK